ncbi:ATP-binding protein [Streptomyces sp. LE64]|uniref:ATP-binding protein n=1 Tax=Streptomyces sp. LE64 TaxID=3448653 RepID=UPI0040410E46
MEKRASGTWRNTTHDWAGTVDHGHLEHIRRNPDLFAPGGLPHLVLEVLAYAADEAECAQGGGRCRVTLHPDGSLTVADDGRGTDTRLDDRGEPVRKPVMATKDLRFFDRPEAQRLPDGHPRRGMSTVAALSSRLTHTNRRRDGAWTQRYAHGVPVTGLVPIPHDGTTGTTVDFLPLAPLRTAGAPLADALARCGTVWPHLVLDVHDLRTR